MRSWWSEPYLWVHLAGIAAVPICLELCLLGLAASESRLPPWLVVFLVAAIGIAPIVWMQWQRPFYIFSLLPLVLKPAQLTDNQRRLLRRFKAPLGRVLALMMAIVSIALLWQLQQWVPLTTATAKIVPWGSIGGLLLAMGAFLMSNLFLQVPASVLAVLVTPEALLRKAEPYPVTSITSDFSLLGIPVKRILPPVAEPSAAISTAPSETPAPTSRNKTLDSHQAAVGPTVTDRATQLASEPNASDLETPAEPALVSESAEGVAESVAPEATVNLEPAVATTQEAAAEPDATVKLEQETEPNAELSELREETETASEALLEETEALLETEAHAAPDPELSSETESTLNPKTSPELVLDPAVSSDPEAAAVAAETDRPSEPEIAPTTEETNWDDEETNWDEPESEPARLETPIDARSGIIEAETVEKPIEAETVREADRENAEAPIEMLAMLENPIEISARLEDPAAPIELTSPENPFDQAAAELPQVEEIELPQVKKVDLRTVQDTVVTIIPDVHIPKADSAADLPPDSSPDLSPGPAPSPNVENTIVTIIPPT